MAGARDDLIHALEQTYSTLARLTESLDDPALDFRPAPDAWSTREILAHLVDDEMYVMRTRMERVVKEDHPHLAPHDEKKWYQARNKTRDALSELLADFSLQRQASLGMMNMLRESDWLREGYQPEFGHLSAEGLLARWVNHDTAHLDQVNHNLIEYAKRP